MSRAPSSTGRVSAGAASGLWLRSPSITRTTSARASRAATTTSPASPRPLRAFTSRTGAFDAHACTFSCVPSVEPPSANRTSISRPSSRKASNSRVSRESTFSASLSVGTTTEISGIVPWPSICIRPFGDYPARTSPMSRSGRELIVEGRRRQGATRIGWTSWTVWTMWT